MKLSLVRSGLLLIGLAIAGTGSAWGASLKLPLRELTGTPPVDNELILHCIIDQRTLQLPVPERWSVQRANLHLRYTVSNIMARESSQLTLKMNDIVVAQMRLNSQAPDVVTEVAIPVELLQPGYNRLTFETIQHSAAMVARNQCETPCSPDLWTNINLKESTFQLDYEIQPVPLDLSKLAGFVFDPRIMPGGTVHIVTEDLSEAAVNSAAVVASGIARRFDYRPVTFTTSRDLRPGVDNVIVGKLAYITRFLGQRGVKLPGADGGYLKVLQLPGADGKTEAGRALLVVTGATDEAVKIAAMTFSNITYAFPGTDDLKAYQFVIPSLEQYSGREVLSADRTYTFKTLNYPTRTARGINPAFGRISFRLPVDFHIRPNQYAELVLNFSYGAGLRSDSALSIGVNGTSVRAIPVSDPAGNFVDGYKLNIPTYLFKPGANYIDLISTLNAPGQICDILQTGGMFLSIYDNSTLKFPAMPHAIEMPRLDLFAFNGFPFSRWPDGHQTTILLAEKDDRVLTAALNLLGMVTQKNGFPLFSAQVSYAPRAEGEIIAIGTTEKLPEALRKAAPLKEGDAARTTVPYPIVRSWQNDVSIAFSSQISALGAGRGLLMEFQSPFESGRTVLTFTASNNDDLVAVSRALLDPGLMSQSRGDVMLIELAKPEAKMMSLDTGKRYITGRSGTSMAIESYLFTRPALHYAILVAVLVLLSAAVYVYMRRRRGRK